jgi:hypothetical protein
MRHLLGMLVLATGTALCPLVAQVVHSQERLRIDVTHIEQNASGFLITVEITNVTKRTMFLPQSPGWPTYAYRPEILSLAVQQWTDGKTNLLVRGRSLSSSLPSGPGYFSVGPCNDIGFNGHWIELAPSRHITDQIQAIEPSSVDYIPSSCTWRHAHLSDRLRISVSAFPSAHSRPNRAISASIDFPVKQH